MKPAPFHYHVPDTLDEALLLLHEYGDEAKVLAGGQSLIPAMNFRRTRPAILIDLNSLAELFYLREAVDGGMRIGAMTRQASIEKSPLVAQHAPLFYAAVPHIAHPQIRNRGTLGGSLANADPGSELPAMAIAHDARFRVRSQTRDRWIPAAEFFLGPNTTALTPQELLVEVQVPPLPARSSSAFCEIARRRGDYAIVGAGAVLTLDQQGQCEAGKLVLFGVDGVPLEAKLAISLLKGRRPDDEAIGAAAECAAAAIEPRADFRATAAYRRHLMKIATQRVLKQAAARLGEAWT